MNGPRSTVGTREVRDPGTMKLAPILVARTSFERFLKTLFIYLRSIRNFLQILLKSGTNFPFCNPLDKFVGQKNH